MTAQHFAHGSRVRDRRTGRLGTVRLFEPDPDPDTARGEVRWDGLFVADELDLVADHLELVSPEHP